MTAPHVTRYHHQLLQLICDKLEIDYSKERERFIKANETAKAETKKWRDEHNQLLEERDQRLAEIDAMNKARDIKREQKKAEAERLRNLTPAEIADLKAAYIHADQNAQAAWDQYLNAATDASISAIDRDKIHEEYKWQSKRAKQLREELKIAEGR